MKIYLVETETGEQQFFSKKLLSGHEVFFADCLSDVLEDAEVLSIFVYSRIDAATIDRFPKLKYIATRSTGIDHIDLDACRQRGIAVSTVPTYGENTVAEHTFALILALSRRLREALEANKQTTFSYESIRGFDLKNKTLGIIGSGRIGLHAIRIAKGFDMNVLAFDVHTHSILSEILDFEYVALDELLRRSDIISLHTPLLESTHHILNREAFSKCKRGVLIINTARGQLLDTGALIEALDNGTVAGAGLDVLEDERVMQRQAVKIIGDQIVNKLQGNAASGELRAQNPERIQELKTLMRNSNLIARPNVVFTPHTAFNSREAVDRINQTTVENINGFICGAPLNVVS